jgi:hypothetical protein
MKKLTDYIEESQAVFTLADRDRFNRCIMDKMNDRTEYGIYLNPYEKILLEDRALKIYPLQNKVVVTTFHEDDVSKYCDKYLAEYHIGIYDTFSKFSMPMMTDENKKKYRYMRDQFIPRLFWDELYKM